MRALLQMLSLLWLCTSSWAHADEPPAPLRVPYEPGSRYTAPMSPPPVGACIGGTCDRVPTATELARARPGSLPLVRWERTSRASRRERFAYTGAVLGSVSAALVLGGAVAISLVDDLSSERVTRGVWLGYAAVSTPLVAFSVWLARRESGFEGYKALRALGWLSYACAMTDGALLLSNAFQHDESPRLLSISAGVFGALALLPHALEAVNAARSLRMRRIRTRLTATGTGVMVKF
ncbi:MAG: hypothetical protein JWN04_6810 [Myxococcaceae bacterium]|nr:hypothetical protein [Myxococcaceae bacterium]